MKTEIETVIKTQDEVRVSVSDFGDDVWICLMGHSATFSATLTKGEAEQLIVGLQAVLAQHESTT